MANVVDLRSDTVTQPSADMLAAMGRAELGDDVLGDDPTTLALEERVCGLLGKEAAVFTPSGTMANQLAIRAQTTPGDEMICHADSHVIYYETGAPAALSGVSTRALTGERGHFGAAALRASIKPADTHFPPARLVVVENTHNRGGGSIWPATLLAELSTAARSLNLAMHLDGARLMNACVARGCAPTAFTKHVDTVSMCFSKGLGAPVGSILCGPRDVITRARRYRKMFGGGMRQTGLLAGAALYALDHHVERLAEDHAAARGLADRVSTVTGLSVDPLTVETNIVYFEVDVALGTASQMCDRLSEVGVLVLPEGPQRVRAVTHLDVTAAQVASAGEAIARTVDAMQ